MLKRIVGGVGGLVVILVVIALKFGAGWGIGFLGAKATAPDVGDCVTVSGETSNVDVHKATCGDENVVYKVQSKSGSCDTNEDEVTYTVGGKEAVDLCLFLDVQKGDCLQAGSDSFVHLVSCTAPGGQVIKIADVLDSADGTCPKGTSALTDKTRDVALCFVRAG